ncbi:hypothetical protein GCM10010401_14000 [Rarobacter faecitabidus]|uniref:Uncharacterized protein n=1 Tax=Rarobacter faecitabidus TaxID=13243 RepID=A0A542ZDY5_RARFA|nr:hypothetical protein [Rarobacter faecitabidus]TQL58554.1 hypothetical protein FB461_1969 [Rarobacter faecitabidus]
MNASVIGVVSSVRVRTVEDVARDTADAAFSLLQRQRPGRDDVQLWEQVRDLLSGGVVRQCLLALAVGVELPQKVVDLVVAVDVAQRAADSAREAARVAAVVVKPARDREWVAAADFPPAWREDLPADLTGEDDALWCEAKSHPVELLGAVCTRRRGHTGRHARGDGERIVAVWR